MGCATEAGGNPLSLTAAGHWSVRRAALGPLVAGICLLTLLGWAATGSARAATGVPGVLENNSPPTIVGDLAVGATVSAAPGGWTGLGPISYGYQWQACHPACASVPGATTSAYPVDASDLGGRLQVVVTATNPLVSYAATSPLTTQVAPAADEVQAAVQDQLVPPDRTLAVAIALQTLGYRLPFDAPVTGEVTIDWYLGADPQLPADSNGPMLVASGSTRIRRLGPHTVWIEPTRRGRRLVKRSRTLTLTALATLTPAQSIGVIAVQTFKLS